MKTTRHLRISGRVQGVGYRDAQPAQGESDRPYVGFEMLPTA